MLCLSEVEAEDVRAVARRARTAVVPNAVAPRAPIERAAVEPPVLVALCRLDVRQKGLDRMAAIAAAAPALRLRVHGDRDRNEPAAVEHLLAHLPANLEVHEPVHGAAKEAALAGATAYVALSRWEGISMAVLEALAGGLPCIVSRYVARTLGDEAGTAVAVLDDRLLDDDPAAAGRARSRRSWPTPRRSAHARRTVASSPARASLRLPWRTRSRPRTAPASVRCRRAPPGRHYPDG